ncbi:MAG TPA: ribosome recycling factor, partial [bacterium]|nr:ribosome recycling factor [bacterium]
HDIKKMRSNRATPDLLADIKVEAYGTLNPLKNISTISVVDAKNILVQPWDKSLVEEINKGLMQSDLNLSIQVEGEHVRVIFPDMTLERRKEMVKIMKQRIESARVAIRSVRQDMMQSIDQSEKDGISEDQAFRMREDVEKTVKDYNQKVEDLREKKENELMTL